MNNKKFKDYDLDSRLLKAIDILGYENPTEVQERVIPLALEGKDVVVKSQTGSGKTAAFGIPICHMVDWEENKVQALVLTPTRELSIQVGEDIFNIGRFKRLKVMSIFGKSPFYRQERDLKQKTHVVVGTPGRVIDHIERGTFDVSNIKYLVIDEADEMFNMGFIDQVKTIIDNLPEERITMMFSATLAKDIEELSDKYMDSPVEISIEDQSMTVDNIDQEVYKVEENDRLEMLKDITILENPDSCIVFCNTRDMVDDVYSELKYEGYTADRIHGGMEQDARIRVMENFRDGSFRYLVATDVAARGIDIDNISHVINYEIPRETESYVHRIGRTGRAGNRGKAISLVGRREERGLRDIELFIEKDISIKELPKKEVVEEKVERFEEKMDEKIKVEKSDHEKLSKNILKLHINAGKKTKMRPTDIVGTLCNIDGMTADDIGVINVIDVSTFVEILNGKGEMVLEELQTKTIKGRVRKVSRANEQGKDSFIR